MTVTLYDAQGTPVCGDAAVDQHMRDRCDDIHGYIKDDATGDTIYPEEG